MDEGLKAGLTNLLRHIERGDIRISDIGPEATAAAFIAGLPRPRFLLWWTTQAEAEVIGNEYGDGLVSGIPEYIRREWASRRGRPGRGRLWVSPELKDAPTELDVPGRTGITQFIDAGSAAGIVIRTEDAVHLRELPGLLTTTTYERFISTGAVS